MAVDPNALEEEPLSKSDGSHTASTVIGLLLVAAVFALIYFYVLPASASTQCGDASWYEAKSNSSGSFTAATVHFHSEARSKLKTSTTVIRQWLRSTIAGRSFKAG